MEMIRTSRILDLFEQASTSDNEQSSSDNEGEINHISEQNTGRNREQECSHDEQEAIVSTSNCFLLLKTTSRYDLRNHHLHKVRKYNNKTTWAKAYCGK